MTTHMHASVLHPIFVLLGGVRSQELTCYLRLSLRVEGVGHCIESWPGALSGHPHPHPLKLTKAI